MSRTIEDLRTILFETLDGIRDGKIELDKARAINEVSKTIVDSAKVEVDFIRATGTGETGFIPDSDGRPRLPSDPPGNGIGSAVQQLTAAGGKH